MQMRLKKVPGGYELFIPDELAASIGLADGKPVEAVVLAEQLVVSQPEFVQAARDAMYSSITPETLHNEPDDWNFAKAPARAIR